MKFIHFADAHLDSPFRGLSFLPSNSFNQIYQAANQSFERIVDLALKEKVDLVLIAGDTFDSNQPSPHSQLFFAKQIKRLTDAEIQVVMIFGNHDHTKVDDLLITPSPYFKLLGPDEKVESVSYETKSGFKYDVVGFSYLNNHIAHDVIPDFPEKSNNYTFGIMHAQQKTDHQDVYAPFALSEVTDLNYDYFAFGHIHQRRVLSDQPWVVYPGNIQGRHINETALKGCYLGEIDEKTRQTTISFKRTSPIVWEKVTLKLAGPVSKKTLHEKILATLKSNDFTTYFSLTIENAQYLTEEERELIQDSSYWQGISLELSQNSQLVDVRFKTQSLPSLSVEDQATSKQAAEEIFTNSALKEIAAGWVKKSTLTQELADDPEFLTEIKEMSQVKLSSKLRGVSYEIEEN